MQILMKKNLMLSLGLAVAASSLFGQIELTTNGGFEAGDTSSWVSFPTPSSTFLTTNDAASGSFAGELTNTAVASAAVVKQANLGIGTVVPGQAVTISFDAKGVGAVGGVSFAEFFSEIDGGGVSASEILGGAPLALTDTYQSFSFNSIAGPDVSGGITLQLTATTGGATGSTMSVTFDNVSVSVVPEPGTYAAILGALSLGFILVRRRMRVKRD